MIGNRRDMQPRIWSSFLVMEVCLVLAGGAGLIAQTPSKTPLAQKQPPAGMFDLQVAQSYEKQERWKEAEQEYLQAGRVGAPCVKKEALAALDRLKKHRPSDRENFDFELAKLYEDEHQWPEAEQHYAAAAKGETKVVRDAALDGVKRAGDHLRVEHFVGEFDRWLGYAARLLALAFVVVLARRLYKVRKSMEIVPFEAENDNGAKQVNFVLASALEDMPNVVGPKVFAGTEVLTKLPGVEGLPDPAQDVEIGGVKLPLTEWIKMIRLPKVRVLGCWDFGMRTARARVLRRTWPFSYAEKRSSRFYVPSEPGDAQELQLRLFAYDVLIKSIFLKRYGR